MLARVLTGCGMFCFLISAVAAQQSKLDSVELFPPGMNGIALYRIPGIVCSSQGTLLAYCEARRNGKSDWGEIEVHMRRSTDGGASWTEPMSIAHRGPRIEGNPRKDNTEGSREQTVNNPVAIASRRNNQIVMLYCVNYSRCFCIKSQDDGLSWTEPREITATFEPFRQQYDWQVIATGPGHGIQIGSGRMLVPIWLAYGKKGDHAPSAAAIIYSDDEGESWQAGEIVFPNRPPFTNPNETTVSELSTGEVMLICRSPSKPNRKLVSTSHNGASDWTEPVFHPSLLEPICMASIVAYPKQPGMQLFSNPHSVAIDNQTGKEIPASKGPRRNLSIKLSYDDGKSWPVNKTLAAGPSAYSDLAVMPNGEIVCLYEGDQTIRAAIFNLQWLTADD